MLKQRAADAKFVDSARQRLPVSPRGYSSAEARTTTSRIYPWFYKILDNSPDICMFPRTQMYKMYLNRT